MRKQSKKPLFLAVFSALVIPLMFAGIASAKYMSDGGWQDPVAGIFQLPTDFVCIVGVHADGTLDIADGVTTRRDCIYLNKGTMNNGTLFDLTGMTTSAQCINAGGAGNTDGAGHSGTPGGAKHSFATTICLGVDGVTGLSLRDLDRTYSMCVAKGGTWKQTSAPPPYPGAPGTYPTPGFTGACVAYGAQFKGQDANGTPLAFGAEGTTAATAGAGYCYTSLNMTTAFQPTPATLCPASDGNSHPNAGFTSSTAYDWSYASSKCTYSKGIAGYLNAALT